MRKKTNKKNTRKIIEWIFFDISFDAYRIQSYCQSKDLMFWFWNKFANEYRRSIVKGGRETSSKNYNKTGTFVEIAYDELNTVSSNQQRKWCSLMQQNEKLNENYTLDS